MPSLYDVPEDVVRAHIIPCLPLEDIVSLMMSAPFLVYPVRTSKVWEVALAELDSSNTLNRAVTQELADGQESTYFSEHILSDPRLLGAAYTDLPALIKFQKLAPFCRSTVSHFRALHNIMGKADWTFLWNYCDDPTTARDLHVNLLVDLEMDGRKKEFCRYNVMANLMKLNLCKDELENPEGSCYWYSRLGDPDCDPFTGSSYRDMLSTYFVDAFLEDEEGYGHPDPALTNVEVGSNAHLVHLTQRSFLSKELFGPRLLHHFELLEAARVSLPQIIEDLEEQEEEWALEVEAEAEAEEERKKQLVKVGGEGGEEPLVKEGGEGGGPLVKEGGDPQGGKETT